MTYLIGQGLPNIPLGDLGPWGLIGIVVLLVLTGRLVPKSTLDEKNETIRELRQAYENERERGDVWASHAERLLQGQRLIVEVIESFRSAVESVRQGSSRERGAR